MMQNTDLMTLERQERIVELVNARGSLTVPDLSETFAVSEATIRRDLIALAERRLIQRVHGGAMRLSKVATSESPIIQRQTEQVEAKARIGKATAELVHNGETLLLLGGSTGLAVARELAQHQDLTIVTDSLLVANELLGQRNHRMILIGGSIDPDEQAVRGTLSRLILQQIHVDKVIIGAKAISVSRGISAETPEEAELFRGCMACADQIIVVSDSSKFHKAALAKVIGLQDVHILVTDDGLEPEQQASLHDLGIHLIIV
ncbi:MAG: DeoR/GlpR transcriptional regulator [Chloroflexi bacterium]|nr:DeoR/GlpR transcriptional regulator [Chloroflexota bacterium]